MYSEKRSPNVSGFSTIKFRGVEREFRNNFESGAYGDGGAGLTVYHNGERVVNLCGGYADVPGRHLWADDTMGTLYSATKIINYLCLCQLIEKKMIRTSNKVSYYWPEFGENGKQDITIEDVLCYRTGIPNVDKQLTSDDLKDADYIRQLIVDRVFEHAPENGNVMYSVTVQPAILNELIRRCDPLHREAHQFYEQEFRTKYDLDVSMSVPDEHFHRISIANKVTKAEMINAPVINKPVTDETNYKTERLLKLKNMIYKNPPELLSVDFFQRRDVAKSVINGNAGYASASGAAKLVSLFCKPGLAGESPFSDETLSFMTTVLDRNKTDVITGMKLDVYRGFTYYEGCQGLTFIGAGGLIGQMLAFNQDKSVAFAHITNQVHNPPMAPRRQPRVQAIMNAIEEVVIKIEK